MTYCNMLQPQYTKARINTYWTLSTHERNKTHFGHGIWSLCYLAANYFDQNQEVLYLYELLTLVCILYKYHLDTSEPQEVLKTVKYTITICKRNIITPKHFLVLFQNRFFVYTWTTQCFIPHLCYSHHFHRKLLRRVIKSYWEKKPNWSKIYFVMV